MWWSDVAGKMQQYADAAGFSVVREFVGHGIGTQMHEEPKVPNFVSDELFAGGCEILTSTEVRMTE